MQYDLELQSIAIGDTIVKLFVPREDSVKRVYQAQKVADGSTPFPYWAKVWPSALALSAFIQQHSYFLKDKNVLELAAGLGLPSLLAAPYAHTVCCSDYLSEALEVMDRSIAVNNASNLTTRLVDWHHLPNDLTPDVLLLSDINYDPKEFEVLYGVLTDFLNKDAVVLLSTPQRLMAKPFIERLLPWCEQQEEVPVPYQGEMTLITVMVLRAI